MKTIKPNHIFKRWGFLILFLLGSISVNIPGLLAQTEGEFGILSETYVYPDGIRLDVDSKLFIWNGTLVLRDDTSDKREGEKSLKCMVTYFGWFGFGIIWDPDQDNQPDAKNMSAYANGSLNFWIKTNTPVKVGIEGKARQQKWVAVGVPSDNQWRFVTIPFSEFSSDPAFFSEVYQFFMVLNNSSASQGRNFHLDNVRWNKQNVGPLDHIVITPSGWDIPKGFCKAFEATGYDANNQKRDIYPTWSISGGITGNFYPIQGPFTIFRPFSTSGTGTIKATEGSYSDTVTVRIKNINWNDFFNIYRDEGMYGSLNKYDADDNNGDGDGIENNNILLETVTTQHPPQREMSLRAIYTITNSGWAGLFFGERRSLIVNPNMEIGSKTPVGWNVYGSSVTDETGWVTEEYLSPDHSLKLINTAGNNTYWAGQIIGLESPYPTKLKFSGWAKADNIDTSTSTKFRILFWMIFQDGTSQWYATGLNFTKGTHDWELVESTYDFGKPIVNVRPFCQIGYGTGTAWFDNVDVQLVDERTRDLSRFEDGYLYFWVKTPVDLEIGIRSSNILAGTERSKAMLSDYHIPIDNTWHEVIIALNDFLLRDKRIELANTGVFLNLAAVGPAIGGGSESFFISDVRYIRRKNVFPVLSVEIRRRNNDEIEPSGEITWSTAQLGGGWAVADQYLVVHYDNLSPSWGVQIFTDNMSNNASPRYNKGDPTKVLSQQPGGLIGDVNTLLTCPMAWMVLDDKDNNIPVPVESDNGKPVTDPGYMKFFKSDINGMWGTEIAKNEWSWLKDVNSTKWNGDTDGDGRPDPSEIVSDFSQTGDEYSTFLTPIGIATGWIDVDTGKRSYILNPESPVYLYLAANFKMARELQKYQTNTLTLELYHY